MESPYCGSFVPNDAINYYQPILDYLKSIKPDYLEMTAITLKGKFDFRNKYRIDICDTIAIIHKFPEYHVDNMTVIRNYSGYVSSIKFKDQVDVVDLTGFNCAKKVKLWFYSKKPERIIKKDHIRVCVFVDTIEGSVKSDTSNLYVDEMSTEKWDKDLKIKYPDASQYEQVDLSYVKKFRTCSVNSKYFNDCKDKLKSLVLRESDELNTTCLASKLHLGIDDDYRNRKLEQLNQFLPNLKEVIVLPTRKNFTVQIGKPERKNFTGQISLSNLPEAKKYRIVSINDEPLLVDRPLDQLVLVFYLEDLLRHLDNDELLELVKSINFSCFPKKKIKIGDLVIKFSDKQANVKSTQK